MQLIRATTEQVVSAVTTHMLSRLLRLFAPAQPPGEGLKSWRKVSKDCEEWAKLKHTRLSKWTKGRKGFREESAEKYLSEKVLLLEDLTKGGKAASQGLLDVDAIYAPTNASTQAVKALGFDIDFDALDSHVHVSERVMGLLDEVYIQHYGSGGACALRLCFSMMGPSKESKKTRRKYDEYLDGVRKVLDSLTSGSKTASALGRHGLQAFGSAHAAAKLDPLFRPALGRICLPLPTVTMLKDLKDCLEIDGDIMAEVISPHRSNEASL
jgi:hypothetical protein